MNALLFFVESVMSKYIAYFDDDFDVKWGKYRVDAIEFYIFKNEKNVGIES